MNTAQSRFIPLFAFLFILGLTVLIVIGIEASLRLVGYGYSSDPFEVVPGLAEMYRDNTAVLRKYHPGNRGNLNTSLRNRFAVEKPDSTLRGFVIGGSTAQGYPYESNHSFSKMTESALDLGTTYDRVEILNVGYSAMTSYYVRDAAPKLIQYDPDFVVIYSGHNEYYGTIGEVSSRGHLSRLVYLFIKEFRLGQLFLGLFEGGSSRTESRNSEQTQDGEERPVNLMTRQFSERSFPRIEEREAAVAQNYLKNIQHVVRELREADIEVFLIEPVSNLAGMPPFAGQKGSEREELYRAIATSIANGSYQDAANRLAQNELVDDPMLHFLRGTLYTVQESPGDALQSFERARDYDSIPFRARTELVSALADAYANAESVHYIPLQAPLISEYGLNGVGNTIFIDHLHFDYQGQLFLSRQLSDRIADVYGFSDQERQSIQDYLADTSAVKTRTNFLPFFEGFPYMRVESLASQPPFANMLLQPNFMKKDWQNNIVYSDPELNRVIQENLQSFESSFKAFSEYLFENRSYNTLYRYLEAYRFLFPANPNAYQNLGSLLVSLGNEQGLGYFESAFVLSDFDPEVWSLLESTYTQLGNQRELERLRTTYSEHIPEQS